MRKTRIARRKGVLMDSLILFGTSSISGLFIFLFYLFLGKTLGPERYGLFGVLLSIFLIVGVYANVIGVVITRYTALFQKKSQPEKVKAVMVFSFRWIALTGFVIFLFVALFSNSISSLLGLRGPENGEPLILPVILLGLLIWSHMIFMNMLGILNGLQRFVVYGVLRILHTAIILLVGIPIVLLGAHVSGAVFAMFLATVITIPVGMFMLSDFAKIHVQRIGKVKLKRFILLAAVASFSVGVLLSGDVVVAKIFFTPTNAGFYSALATLGSIGFFVTTALALVAFPKMVEEHADGRSSGGLLRESLNYAAAICLLLVAMYFLFPGFFVNLLFTREYLIAPFLGWYALSKGLLSIANIFMVYHLAHRNYRLLFVVFPFAMIFMIMMLLLHSNILELIVVGLFVNALLVVSLAAITDEPIFRKFGFKKLFRI